MPFQPPLDKNTSALSCSFVIPWIIPVIPSLHWFLASFSRWSIIFFPVPCAQVLSHLLPPDLSSPTLFPCCFQAQCPDICMGAHKLPYSKNNPQTLLLSITFCHFLGKFVSANLNVHLFSLPCPPPLAGCVDVVQKFKRAWKSGIKCREIEPISVFLHFWTDLLQLCRQAVDGSLQQAFHWRN